VAPDLAPEAPFESSEAPTEVIEHAAEVAPLPTTVATPPSWQRFANSGEYEAALFELGQGGGFEAVLLDSNAEQLMLLADVARATGQTQRALAALRRIVTEFRGEPVAPLAAYSLGNLLEKSGDTRGAAQAFSVYRALSPEGDFAEDALVRQLRTAVERGDRDHAEQLAAQYRAGFPEGRRGEDVEEWLAELDARELAGDAGETTPAETPAEADHPASGDESETDDVEGSPAPPSE
jgi:TolA-binding protein